MTADHAFGSESQQLPLLTTKLNMPPHRPNLVKRPRLAQPLEEGLKRKLTLISAPAGFGKTTLLSDWFHQNETQVAWLSLDNSDNDFAHFLAHFITGLQVIDAGIGKAALSELQSPQPPPVNTVMTSLVNDINTVSDDFAFVLDDYHFISAQKVHGVVEFLLDHMPPVMHIFITTRSDPSIPMARLRSNNELIELRASDMSFTADEVEVFLNRMMGLGLSKNDVLLLESRCEGWIGGLQLAALSIQGRSDVSNFIKAFTGDDRHIADYLMEEVLSRQPDAIRIFLLKTSILERMTGSLCDSVTGRTDGEGVLDELEKANLFLIPLDNSRRWYRYHHLFAELLRQRLPRLKNCPVPDLHRQASDWFEQNGFVGEAIDHALKAQDFNQVTRLVEQIAHTVLMKQGETSTILRWLDAIPDNEIRNHPRLSLAYAWTLIYELRIDEIEQHLQNAERVMREKPDNDVQGEVDAIRATIAAFQGSSSRSIELFRGALKRLSAKNMPVRAIVSMGLGYAHMVRGDMVAASKNLDEAIGMNEANGNSALALKAACFLAFVRLLQGRLHKATETLQQALQLAGKWDLLNAPVMSRVFVGLAELARERNDLVAATQKISKATRLCERSGDPFRSWLSLIVLSNIKCAQGVVRSAIDVLRKAKDFISSSTKMPLACTRTAACRVRALLVQNQTVVEEHNKQEIIHWVQSFNLKEDWLEQAGALILPGQGCEFEHFTLARGLISMGELDKALELLVGLREKSETAGRLRSVIENFALQSLALHLQGKADQAVNVLQQALVLAEPEGFIRIFIDAGPPLAEVLEKILTAIEEDRSHVQTGFSRGYVRKLLLAFKSSAKTEPDGSRPEPLSERELEVLQILAVGMSNREIAERLFISLNTVKTHIKSINSKLNVHGRGRAVAHARRLGLL